MSSGVLLPAMAAPGACIRTGGIQGAATLRVRPDDKGAWRRVRVTYAGALRVDPQNIH
jgi:hypothetical protein